jgi:hypothetical protein
MAYKKACATALFALVQVFFIIAGVAGARAFEGPLHIANSHPLFFAIGTPQLSSARPDNSLQFDFTYSSTYVVRRSPQWDFGIDLEAALMEVTLRKLITATTEASVDVPVMSYNSGFLDGFLESYHNAFGFPDYGRSQRPHNEFLFDVRRNGRPVMEGKAGEMALGDVRVGLKQVLAAGDPLVSLYVFLSLPTGDAEKGYGSGSLKGGAAVLLDKALSPAVMAYLNLGVVLTGDLKAIEEVPLRDFVYGGAALEWDATERLSLNGQLYIQSSPIEETGVGDIDDAPSLLSFGGRYRTARGQALEFSFSEDPTTAGAPDFMVGLGYILKF